MTSILSIDVRADTFRFAIPGPQDGTTKLTHIPTGISVEGKSSKRKELFDELDRKVKSYLAGNHE